MQKCRRSNFKNYQKSFKNLTNDKAKNGKSNAQVVMSEGLSFQKNNGENVSEDNRSSQQNLVTKKIRLKTYKIANQGNHASTERSC